MSIAVKTAEKNVGRQAERPASPGHRGVGRVRDQLRPHGTALLVAATTLAATALFWLLHRSLVDDAYITLTYARTLADHGEWGMLPGHEANSATSPLNVLLLGGLSVLTGDPLIAAGLLYVLTCVTLVLALRGLGYAMGLDYRVVAIGGPLLIASPLLASTVGLETMLVVAAIVLLAWACVRGAPAMAGLTAGVLLWLRLDMAVIAAVLMLATPAIRHRLGRTVALVAAVVTPWLLLSWITLGSAIPDTLVIKQDQAWGNFARGLVKRYYEPYPWAVVSLLVVGAVGLLSVLTWVWWRRLARTSTPIVPGLAAAGAAYFGLLWLLDVPPYFWYYAPTFTTLALATALGLAAIGGPSAGRVLRAGAIAIGSGLLVLTAIPWWYGVTTQAPLREMPIHGNWALPSEYERIGRELGQIVGDTPVHSPGEVGALAYYCECTIVDRFSDRALIADQIEDARDDNWLYALNYLGLRPERLQPIEPGYWLRWRPGPDLTGRGWDATGVSGGYRAHGHFELRRMGEDGSLR